MGSWCKSGQGLRGSSHRKRSGFFLMCCMCKHPYYCPCPAQTDVALGLSHLSVSRPSFHLGCGSLRPSVGLCCDASRVRGSVSSGWSMCHVSQGKPGSHWRNSPSTLPTLFQEQACTFLMSGVLVSSSPDVSPGGPPTSQGALSSGGSQYVAGKAHSSGRGSAHVIALLI